MTPTPTTAVERLNSFAGPYIAVSVAKDLLTRCRIETLQEVEGLELMQDESENKEDHYTERSRSMAMACNLLRSDLRTQLTLLKGKK